jgi:hypothetical protein
MIYNNGTMQLICIQGKNKKTAIFICISNNELIQAENILWNGKDVSWGRGDYMGSVTNYLIFRKGEEK